MGSLTHNFSAIPLLVPPKLSLRIVKANSAAIGA